MSQHNYKEWWHNKEEDILICNINSKQWLDNDFNIFYFLFFRFDK